MRRLFLLVLIAPLLAANARAQTLRAWPLQSHCSLQALRTNGFLTYGSLSFQPLPYEKNHEPEIAVFQAVSEIAEAHPFCAVIYTAIQSKQIVLLDIHRSETATTVLRAVRLEQP